MGILQQIFFLSALSLPIALYVFWLKLRRLETSESEWRQRFSKLEKELVELKAQIAQNPVPFPPDIASAPDRNLRDQAKMMASPSHGIIPPIPKVEYESTTPEVVPDYWLGKENLRKTPPPLVESRISHQVKPAAEPVAHPFGQGVERPAPEPNLEQFLGAKLFAWMGGLALFLGIAFFVKYSFEHNLISPGMRVVIGITSGIGLGLGGIMVKRKNYQVTSDTLLATGVVVLYASIFAAHARYQLIGAAVTFIAMSAITCGAFLLAARLNAQVVAVLGMVGGFLTPPLLSTGVDRPLALFGYVSLLDIGLLALVARKRWHYLAISAAIGTVLMLVGWLVKFNHFNSFPVAFNVFAWFNFLFAAFWFFSEKRDLRSPLNSGATLLVAFTTLLFDFFLAGSSTSFVHPVRFLFLLLLADLVCLAVTTREDDPAQVSTITGFGVFVILALWMSAHYVPSGLPWFLGAVLGFALLHSLFPIWLKKRNPNRRVGSWTHLFPAIALLLMFLPVLKGTGVSVLFWAAVLAVDVIAFVLAIATGAWVSVLVLMVLTGFLSFAWVIGMPPQIPELPFVLLIIGFFGSFFFGGATFLLKRSGLSPTDVKDWSERWESQLPALSCVMPFLLLSIIAGRFEIRDPTSIFLVATGLVLMLFGLILFTSFDAVALVSLVCVLGLEFAWHETNWPRGGTPQGLVWYLWFYAVYTIFPFLFLKRLKDQPLAWLASVLSGPLHFFLIYRGTVDLVPTVDLKGLIPAVLALPPLLGMWHLARSRALEGGNRTRLLAWFGGSALFFITLIFPIQFEKQWLTLGWALEGAALIWLFRRVPYDKLLWLGVGLLTCSFCRLALNIEVFRYQPLSGTPIFNWLFYTYGITTAALLWAANRLRQVDASLDMQAGSKLLYTLGTILAFFLLNIEIAHYFSDGEYLTFNFSGNFGRDMTYSIAWALFALALLLIGLTRKVMAVRYAGIALLAVTLLKLFFHDLNELAQLYRIGAFIGVSIILMIASFLYQKFMAVQKHDQRG